MAPASDPGPKARMLTEVRLFARMRPAERKALLTEKGARERMKEKGITVRQSIAHLPPTGMSSRATPRASTARGVRASIAVPLSSIATASSTASGATSTTASGAATQSFAQGLKQFSREALMRISMPTDFFQAMRGANAAAMSAGPVAAGSRRASGGGGACARIPEEAAPSPDGPAADTSPASLAINLPYPHHKSKSVAPPRLDLSQLRSSVVREPGSSRKSGVRVSISRPVKTFITPRLRQTRTPRLPPSCSGALSPMSAGTGQSTPVLRQAGRTRGLESPGSPASDVEDGAADMFGAPHEALPVVSEDPAGAPVLKLEGLLDPHASLACSSASFTTSPRLRGPDAAHSRWLQAGAGTQTTPPPRASMGVTAAACTQTTPAPDTPGTAAWWQSINGLVAEAGEDAAQTPCSQGAASLSEMPSLGCHSATGLDVPEPTIDVSPATSAATGPQPAAEPSVAAAAGLRPKGYAGRHLARASLVVQQQAATQQALAAEAAALARRRSSAGGLRPSPGEVGPAPPQCTPTTSCNTAAPASTVGPAPSGLSYGSADAYIGRHVPTPADGGSGATPTSRPQDVTDRAAPALPMPQAPADPSSMRTPTKAAGSPSVGQKRKDLFSIPLPSIVDRDEHPALQSASKRVAAADRTAVLPQGPWDLLPPPPADPLSDAPPASSSNPTVTPLGTPAKEGAVRSSHEGAASSEDTAAGRPRVLDTSGECGLAVEISASEICLNVEAGGGDGRASGSSEVAGEASGQQGVAPPVGSDPAGTGRLPGSGRGASADMPLMAQGGRGGPVGARRHVRPPSGPAQPGLGPAMGPLQQHRAGLAGQGQPVIAGFSKEEFMPMQAQLRNRLRPSDVGSAGPSHGSQRAVVGQQQGAAVLPAGTREPSSDCGSQPRAQVVSLSGTAGGAGSSGTSGAGRISSAGAAATGAHRGKELMVGAMAVGGLRGRPSGRSDPGGTHGSGEQQLALAGAWELLHGRGSESSVEPAVTLITPLRELNSALTGQVLPRGPLEKGLMRGSSAGGSSSGGAGAGASGESNAPPQAPVGPLFANMAARMYRQQTDVASSMGEACPVWNGETADWAEDDAMRAADAARKQFSLSCEFYHPDAAAGATAIDGQLRRSAAAAVAVQPVLPSPWKYNQEDMKDMCRASLAAQHATYTVTATTPAQDPMVPKALGNGRQEYSSPLDTTNGLLGLRRLPQGGETVSDSVTGGRLVLEQSG